MSRAPRRRRDNKNQKYIRVRDHFYRGHKRQKRGHSAVIWNRKSAIGSRELHSLGKTGATLQTVLGGNSVLQPAESYAVFPLSISTSKWRKDSWKTHRESRLESAGEGIFGVEVE